MVIKVKNRIKKGETVPVIADGDRIILLSRSTENRLDITELLDRETRINIKHTGKALAVAISGEELSICYFVQLHTHSQFSILDGMSKLSDIAKKSSGVTAVTDHGNMFAMLQWQLAMEKAGKKPIFGFEAYAESVDGSKDRNHLILLAKNETGKQNLIKLTSDSFYNFYKKPHVSLDMLKNCHEGVICMSACLGGEVARTADTGSIEDVIKVAGIYKEIFGDDYYLEIQRHNIPKEDKVNKVIIEVSKKLNIKLVATNDSHYMMREDGKSHEVLLCVNQKKTLSEPHFDFEGDGYYYMTDNEMTQKFWDLPEAVSNTLEIADKCNLKIETGVYHLPKFEVPSGFEDETAYLTYLVNKGFEERFKGTDKLTDPEYLKRLNDELNTIISMGFPSYFLIVWDYVNWAKDNGILVGPGRGSAAGSLVSYCLKITDLEPIKYGLLFERFLNPDRISMPDIDMDFEFSKRDLVKEYVRKKYGEKCVCDIITFGCMGQKQAVQDCARVLNDRETGQAISRLISDKSGSLKESLENPELKNLYDTDKTAREIIDFAESIEGTPRQTGINACGVVISDVPIQTYVPTILVNDSKGEGKSLVTQIDKAYIEDLGVLKMDFLGLKTLSVIEQTLKSANETRVKNGCKPFANYREITITDPYVYAEISEGKSFAVFQIESEGMRNFMSDLFSDVKPKIAEIERKYGFTGYLEYTKGEGTDRCGYDNAMTSFGEELFERMIAGVSLYRPGPMDYIPDYIKGMKNPESIVYDVPQLEPILKNTYGVIVYQEQVMMTVRELAGFTMGQSDTIRKAMGKKKKEILDEYKPYFIEGSGEAVDGHTGKRLDIRGCIANGIPREKAEQIWEKMSNFASYAFNKSHAGVYAVITMTCAYLKHYFKVPYLCAMINTYIDSSPKLRGYISVAKKEGIKILPPDINLSDEYFKVAGNNIRFGFKGLMGISKNSEVIVKERHENGLYFDMQDFCDRTVLKKVNKKNVEALIYTGCFDGFAGTRRGKVLITESLIKNAKSNAISKASGQLSFFDELLVNEKPTIDVPDVDEFSSKEFLDKEYEVAGMYVTRHPLDDYEDALIKNSVSEIGLISDEEGNVQTGACNIAGVVKKVFLHSTKKDAKTMANMVIEDRSGDISVVVFPKTYQKYSNLVKEGGLVYVSGKVQVDESFGLQLIAEVIIPVEGLKDNPTARGICVNIPSEGDAERLIKTVSKYPGNLPVYFVTGGRKFMLNVKVSSMSVVILELQNEFGVVNVKMF